MSAASLAVISLLAGWALGQEAWSGLTCRAPRAPDNGLSFIFKEGREVRFACHPGFILVGSAVSLCRKEDARWDRPEPECLPNMDVPTEPGDTSLPQGDSNQVPLRPLFSWESPGVPPVILQGPEEVKESRRLPLINGRWTSKSNDTKGNLTRKQQPGHQTVVTPDHHWNQELDIAEVRHRQQLEAARVNSVLTFPRVDNRQRPDRPDMAGRQDSAEAEQRRWRIVQARKTPNLLYAGSRSASAYRAFPSVSTRTSASGHVTTIIQSHASQNRTGSGMPARWDLSCLQSRSGRRLFIRAPKVPHGHVYRYERKRQPPHEPYLVAEYRCRRGFKMADPSNDALYCRRMDWIGEKPICVQRT